MSLRGEMCSNGTTATMRITWLLLSLIFLLHCICSVETATGPTPKPEATTNAGGINKDVNGSHSTTSAPTSTVQKTTPTTLPVKPSASTNSVTVRNTPTTSQPQETTITGDSASQSTTSTNSGVPSVTPTTPSPLSTRISTSSYPMMSLVKTSASSGSPAASTSPSQNPYISSTAPTTTRQQSTPMAGVGGLPVTQGSSTIALETTVGINNTPTSTPTTTAPPPTTATTTTTTTTTTRVSPSSVILSTQSTIPRLLSTTKPPASTSFSITAVPMTKDTTASTPSAGSTQSPLYTPSAPSTTPASVTEALRKTLQFTLTRANKNKVEADDMANMCKKLMANMQNGTCNLRWTRNKDKIQFESVEIFGTVENSLAEQYYEELTKKGNDNTTLIAILASCGALLIMIIILAICASHHRKPYNENQQHLTEELHTVENGYHDNPTLEVMEVHPEMQEKKVALNGEFNDSWIVPIDNLLKEDIPDEEDTHL